MLKNVGQLENMVVDHDIWQHCGDILSSWQGQTVQPLLKVSETDAYVMHINTKFSCLAYLHCVFSRITMVSAHILDGHHEWRIP